jgi:hypothetical protein
MADDIILTIGGDSSGFKDEAEKVQKIAVKLDGETVTINVDANTDNALRQIKTLDKSLEKLKSEKAKISLDADNKDAKKKIAEIDKAIGKLEGKKIDIKGKLDIDTSKAEKEIKQFADKAESKLSGLLSNIDLGSIDIGGGKGAGGVSSLLGSLGSFSGAGPAAGFAAVGAAVGVAAKELFDFSRELQTLELDVGRLTGETGKGLRDLTADISAIGDTFEQDTKEVLLATNTLMKQFGITGAEATKVVKEGFIEGADINGEFLATLSEYAPQFKEAGLAASQLKDIARLTGQEGIFADKGADVIKEATLRIRELTPATAEAIDGIGLSSKELEKALETGEKSIFDVVQLISKQLGTLPPQSKKVGTAIADIFGGPGEDAGLRFLTRLQDIGGGLDGADAKTKAYAASQKRLLEANEGLAKVTLELFDGTEGLGQSFETFGKEILVFFLELYSEIIDAFRAFDLGLESNVGFLDILSGVLKAVTLPAQALVKVISFFVRQLAAVTNAVSGFIKENETLTSVFEGLGSAISSVGDFLGLTAEKTAPLKEGLGGVSEETENLRAGTAVAVPGVEGLGESIDKTGTSAKKAAPSIKSFTDELAELVVLGQEETPGFDNTLDKLTEMTKANTAYAAAIAKVKKQVDARITAEKVANGQLLIGTSLLGDNTDAMIEHAGFAVTSDQMRVESMGIVEESLRQIAEQEAYNAEQAQINAQIIAAAEKEKLDATLSYSTFAQTAFEEIGKGQMSLVDVFKSSLLSIIESQKEALATQVLVWTAQIFGDQVSQLGFFGIATAAILTGGLLALAGIALGAEGGVVGIDSSYKGKPGATDSIPILVAPKESIISAAGTSATGNSDMLNFMNDGHSYLDYPGVMDNNFDLSGMAADIHQIAQGSLVDINSKHVVTVSDNRTIVEKVRTYR